MLLYEFRYCRLRGANSGQGAYTLMSCDPIGVFDSGLGGLTAVKELLHVLPNEDIVYFGDTGRVPYGNRSRETIMKYAKQDAQFLLSKTLSISLPPAEPSALSRVIWADALPCRLQASSRRRPRRRQTLHELEKSV